MAQATLTSSQVNPTTWLYDIQLDDVGTTNVGTFWFGWVPGEDFMDVNPTDVSSPAGWTDTVTNGGASDGYAIRWVAGSGSELTPGTSLDGFQFESTLSPTQLEGNSSFYPSEPQLTAFVYSGGPFSDAGFQLVVQPSAAAASTPEPSTLAMVFGGVGLLALSRRRRA
jgi:hypothetical protein